MDRSKRVIGLFLIIVSLIGLAAWEKWGKNEFFYDDAVVLREDIERGTVITASMVTAKKINLDEDYLSYEEKEKIIGMQAEGFVRRGVPLFEEYFVEPNLSPDVRRGAFALALPEEMILAKPETLSRGDKVFFFHGKSCVTSAYVSSVTKEDTVEVIVTREQAAELSSIVAAGGKFMLIYQ